MSHSTPRRHRNLFPPATTLREKYRRQPLAPFDRSFVGRTPGIEELNELLAGAVIVPFAIALHDGDQLFERIQPPAVAVERHREIESGLMVGRIGGDLLLKIGNGPSDLGLLGEIERRTRGGDGCIVLLSCRHHGERLFRLIERAGLDMAAHQSGKRRQVCAVLGEKLPVHVRRPGSIARRERSVGRLEQIPLFAANAILGQAFEESDHLASGSAPMKPSAGWPLTKAMTAGID